MSARAWVFIKNAAVWAPLAAMGLTAMTAFVLTLLKQEFVTRAEAATDKSEVCQRLDRFEAVNRGEHQEMIRYLMQAADKKGKKQ